jgi:hypothetical protein
LSLLPDVSSLLTQTRLLPSYFEKALVPESGCGINFRERGKIEAKQREEAG